MTHDELAALRELPAPTFTQREEIIDGERIMLPALPPDLVPWRTLTTLCACMTNCRAWPTLLRGRVLYRSHCHGLHAVPSTQLNAAMSDDKTKRAPQDSKRIDMSERYEVHYWSEEFGVSPYELQEAVDAVGSMPDAVECRLRTHRH